MQNDWNHTIQLFWPHYATRCQPQKKMDRHKYMWVKKHAAKEYMGQLGNKRRRRMCGKIKMKTQWSKTFGMKQSNPKKYIAIEGYLKKQEKSKVSNLTLHEKDLEK